MSFSRSRRMDQAALERKAATPDPFQAYVERVSPSRREALRRSGTLVDEPPLPERSRQLLPSDLADARRREKERRMHCDSGTFSYSNPFFKLVGKTHNGVPTGYGVMYLADGGMVEGTFDDRGELTCNEGCKRWPDGSTYTGPLAKGEAHGEGMYIGANGDEYHGEFACGFRCGRGVLQNRGQSVGYTGHFRNGLFHGQGELTRPRFHAVGEFERGKPHGEVTLTYENKDTFVGLARDGVADCDAGEGNFTSAATGVAFHGRMVRGSRTATPNAFVPSEILVAGSPHVTQRGAKKKRAAVGGGTKFTKTVASASKASGLGHVAQRLNDAMRMASAATAAAEVVPRYVEQLKTERFITVPFANNKPIEIRATFAHRIVHHRPTLTSAAKKVAGKALNTEAAVSFEPEEVESGRLVRLQVFPFPDNDRNVSSESAVRAYHERAQPGPVLLYNQSAMPVTAGLSTSGSRASSPASPPLSPSNRQLSRTGTGLMGSSRSLPQLRGSVGSSQSSRPTAPGAERPKPTEEALYTVMTGGVAAFDLRIPDPGNYYVRFDVPRGSQTVQKVPGVPPTTVDEYALDGACGYVPLRLIRQC